MRRNSEATLLSITLSVSEILCGCAPKKPIISTRSSFRVQTLNNDALLFSPSIAPTQPVNAPVQLTLKNNSATHPSADCFAESGPFRLSPTNSDQSSMQITLPAPERWLGDLEGSTESDGSNDFDSLSAFLTALDRSQQAGCFAKDAGPARDYVLQSVPMKPAESLFNAYGYRLGRSGLDLKPGLQIKIVRAYFRPAAPGEEEHAIKNYLGLSTIVFSVERADGGKLRFQQIGDIQYAPESLAQTAEEANRDLALREVARRPYYRVLFYTYLVPKEHRIAAAVIGAGTLLQLDELERAMRALPEQGCKNPAVTSNDDCFEFNGFVTLSTQINVELNGAVKYVDWGTKLQEVVPKNSLKTLRMQRRFLDTYYDVQFRPGDSSVLSLALIGGDRLTWSKNGHAKN